MTGRFMRLRWWLIGKLAGDMQIVINTVVHDGTIFVREAPIFWMNGAFRGCTFHCETPEIQAKLMWLVAASRPRKTP